MIQVNARTMYETAPRFSGDKAVRQAAIIEAIGPVLASMLEAYEINNINRIANFLGQTCHESAGFRTTEEFATGEAYEGRADLGNNQPGDGVRFKGRGLIQLTGRANYARMSKVLGIDLVGDPKHAADPVLSLKIACEFWKQKNLNPLADTNALSSITRRINGGLTGLDARAEFTNSARVAVMQAIPPDPAS